MPDGIEDKDFHDFTIPSAWPGDTSLNFTPIALWKDIKARKDIWINGDDVYILLLSKDGLQIDSIVNSSAATAIATFDKIKW